MTFQAKLTTKLENYSVDDTIIELNNNVDKQELDDIVKNILKQLDRFDEVKLKDRKFDFLLGGKLLRLNVEEHLKLYSDEIEANEVLSEKLVEVEYILSCEPPRPLDTVSHDDWVSCVDADDQFIISGSYDNSVRLFSTKDRKNLLTIANAHDGPVTGVKFLKLVGSSERNELFFVTCGHDEVSMLRRVNTKTLKSEVVSIYRGHHRSVNCVDVCDDLIATGSFDKTLRLWSTRDDDDTTGELDENDPRAGNKKATSKKQKMKSSEKSINKQNKGALMTLTGHHESITGVKWLDSCNEYKSLATCSMDRSIAIWDVEVGECKRRVLSAKPLLGMDFCSERNLIISASCDRHVRVWDARAPDNATAKTAYTSHNAWVSSVALGQVSTNNFISGGYDNLVKLWDMRSSKACLYDLIGHHDKVLDVNWTNPSYVFSGSADSTLKVFVAH